MAKARRWRCARSKPMPMCMLLVFLALHASPADSANALRGAGWQQLIIGGQRQHQQHQQLRPSSQQQQRLALVGQRQQQQQLPLDGQRQQQQQRQQHQHQGRLLGDSTVQRVPSTVPLGKDFIHLPTLQDAFPHLGTLQAACPPPGTKALVLAMAANTRPDKVCPFLRSWHMHSPATHIIILTDSARQRTAIMGSTHSVPSMHVLVVSTRPQQGTEWHTWRYILYNMVLETCARMGPLPPVMVSDVRDAIALQDVWAHPMVVHAAAHEEVLYALEGNPAEDGTLRMAKAADDGWATGGMHACFDGVDEPTITAAPLMQYGYSCSGTTLGGGQAMLNYSRAMVHAMLHVSAAACWSYHGGDQFVHIWLLSLNMNASQPWAAALLAAHPQLAFKAVPALNGQGPVYTAALGLPIHIDMFGGISVIRSNWTFHPAYLHQYDRDNSVAVVVRLLYPCELTPTSTWENMWAMWHRWDLLFGHQVLLVLSVFTVCVVATTLAVVHVTALRQSLVGLSVHMILGGRRKG